MRSDNTDTVGIHPLLMANPPLQHKTGEDVRIQGGGVGVPTDQERESQPGDDPK
jgi:hypothetical protein